MAEETAPKAGRARGKAAAAAAGSQEGTAAPSPPEPTLTAYYGEAAPKPAEWVKAVRAAARDFAATDVEEAFRQIEQKDPDLRKTFALAGVSKPPPSLRRWLADITRHLLGSHLQGVSIDPHSPVPEQIGRIATGLAPRLRARDGTERTAAENLLRLAIMLLTHARPEFSGDEVLAVLFAPLREREADARLAPTELRTLVQEAGIAQLRGLSLVQAAALDRIRDAERTRAEAQERVRDLDSTLAIERVRVSELREKLATVEARAASLEAEVGGLTQAVADNRQIGAHGTAELLARVRALLAGRIDPLLADAADALEIEPPVLEVARDRINSGRGAIRGEIRWLDESSG